MHSSTFDRCWISRSRTVLGLSLYGERNWPEWITFRPHSSETQVSPTLTSLDHPIMMRGVTEREGNALPRRLATFCAILSILLHLVTLRLVMENGLDEERSTEPLSPGIFLPPHLGPN